MRELVADIKAQKACKDKNQEGDNVKGKDHKRNDDSSDDGMVFEGGSRSNGSDGGKDTPHK